MKIKILNQAQEDLILSRKFYNSISKELGDYFYQSILADIKSLRIYGGIHQKTGDFYRLLAKRFPYAIYYKMIDNTIFIYAIFDTRRDPKFLEKKLKER
jgi:hypothetical protein